MLLKAAFSSWLRLQYTQGTFSQAQVSVNIMSYVLIKNQFSSIYVLDFLHLFSGGAGKNGVSSQPENLKSDSQESEELKSRESKPPMCLQSLKQFKTAGLEALLKLQAWK